MADYTVYVNSSSFTKDAAAPNGTEITVDNPLGVGRGDTVTFKMADGLASATVEVTPTAPPFSNGLDKDGRFQVPNPPDGITLSVSSSVSAGKTYTLTKLDPKTTGFTGGIKVN